MMTTSTGPNWKKRFKITGLVLLAAFFVSFVLQNVTSVSVRFLFWELTVPRILLLSGTLALGLVGGYVVGKMSD